MTLAELVVEIETGPLAPQLARYWAWEFEAPTGPRPTERERQGSWDTKVRRAGRIHPDAAFAIHKILTTAVDGQPSRAEVLGWGTGWSWKQVKYAKLLTRERGRTR